MYQHFFKRLLDILLSFIALVVLSPLLLILALIVRVKLGSPVIFKQKRPGKHEKIFTLYKFRSMTDAKSKEGTLLSDSERLTSFGKKLRATSLDELPELWNILKGDMSIVGPRPLLVRDMVFMTKEQRKRHTIRPGLTGLAQISGRNSLSWEGKLNADLEYLIKISFFKDIKIIIMTFLKVFKSEGICTEGMKTSEDLGDYLFRIRKVSKEDYALKQAKAKSLMIVK